MRLSRIFSTFRNRIVIIVLGVVIGLGSLWFTGRMTKQLRDKERGEVQVWCYAMGHTLDWGNNDPLIQQIINNRNNIPFVILDDKLRVKNAHLIQDRILSHPDHLRKKIEKMSNMTIPTMDGSTLYLFYGESRLLRTLQYFPLVQLTIFFVFLAFAYITFRSTKDDEQNRVWIGLAKETAHQLGTPTSSLMGWLEYLRGQGVDPMAVEEMGRDLTRLSKVVDRFSKIGSQTELKAVNINELVGSCVLYFRTRIPKNVQLHYNGLAIAPVEVMANEALFEWVIENLLKNSLDALQGHGLINVKISQNDQAVNIDVSDTGKGIPRSNFKRIFEPGFSTKTRGWGLGLSLSRRIVEEYHHGKIGVLESEPGRGTTFRITLKQPK